MTKNRKLILQEKIKNIFLCVCMHHKIFQGYSLLTLLQHSLEVGDPNLHFLCVELIWYASFLQKKEKKKV